MNTSTGAAMPNAESTLKHAERLLREAAAEWKDGISINGVPDWQGEPETAAAYRESCAVADALAELRRAETFQQRVQPWLMECFGPMIAGDREERNHRFLEEALELVQACGCSASEAHQLVDYVFGRPVGEPAQEVGGVMVTLAALCLANGLDMHGAAEVELARIWTKVEAIRAKQAAKPKHSPLPMAAAPQAQQPGAAEAHDPHIPIADLVRIYDEQEGDWCCIAREVERRTIAAARAGAQAVPGDVARDLWTECRRTKSTTDGRKHAELHALCDWIMAKMSRAMTATPAAVSAPQAPAGDGGAA